MVTDSGHDDIRFAGKGCQRIKIGVGPDDGFNADTVEEGGLLSRANESSYLKCIRLRVG